MKQFSIHIRQLGNVTTTVALERGGSSAAPEPPGTWGRVRCRTHAAEPTRLKTLG
jgi:hypothetical protein